MREREGGGSFRERKLVGFGLDLQLLCVWVRVEEGSEEVKNFCDGEEEEGRVVRNVGLDHWAANFTLLFKVFCVMCVGVCVEII